MTNITNTTKKIKSFEVFALILVIILGITGAFFLGRISVLPEKRASAITYDAAACLLPVSAVGDAKSAQTDNTPETEARLGAFLASKSGDKYYPAGCGAAERILPNNRVWFATEAEAIESGYEPSTQCASGE